MRLAVILCVVSCLGWAPCAVAGAVAVDGHGGGAPTAKRPAVAPTAPTGPPLVSSVGQASEGGEVVSEPSGSGDPLVSNGLGSPLCSEQGIGGGLSQQTRENCRTSGFIAAGAPTANYAFDIHIDTGVLGISAGGILAAVQDMLLAPAWTVLVWAVHALIVMVEWSFTLDLLDSSMMGTVGRGLRATQESFTRPWLVVVLAVASVTALYHGLIRRRVAETVGEAALVIAMTVAGMWVIVDPTATVGTLGRWANQAGLGTMAAVANGTPADAPGTLANSMQELFSETIGGPWCYMEFGDVGWCEDPSQLDPKLHAAAMRIAAIKERGRPSEGQDSAQVLDSARLLRGARTNGQLVLALPADKERRNSINQSGSLLRVMCQDKHEDSCRGPMAAQAEFRTASGTLARIAGLLAIAAGAAGTLAMLGFIALKLLESALASLLYLLITPAAVLAPGLGEGGRRAFRSWATHLLGSVMSKLVYSVLLGVVLLAVRLLYELHGLGWWTQWILISTMWWGAFRHRGELLGFAFGAEAGSREAGSPIAWAVKQAVTGPLAVVRSAGILRRRRPPGQDPKPEDSSTSSPKRPWPPRPKRPPKPKRPPDPRPRKPGDPTTGQPVGEVGNPASEEPTSGAGDPTSRTPTQPARGPVSRRARRERAAAIDDEQVTRSLSIEQDHATRVVQAAPEIQAGLDHRRDRVDRLRGARQAAIARGDTRRVGTLGARVQRLEQEIGAGEADLGHARGVVDRAARSGRRGGSADRMRERQERTSFLDAQAALPDAVASHRSDHSRTGTSGGGDGEGVQRSTPGRDHHEERSQAAGSGRGRDYVALAGLAGYGRGEYERLDSRRSREARLRIDRELAMRGGSSGSFHQLPQSDRPSQTTGDHPDGRTDEYPDGRTGEHLDGRTGEHLDGRAGDHPDGRTGEHPGSPGQRPRSPVMDDVWEVVAGRKRQLGYGDRGGGSDRDRGETEPRS